jgi:hypothetical protein
VVNTKITDAGREADLAFNSISFSFHGLLTGRGLNLSALVYPSDSNAGQISDLLAGDALNVQGDDKLAALFIKSAGCGYPEDAGVIFLNLLEQLSGQNLFRVGVSFHF